MSDPFPYSDHVDFGEGDFTSPAEIAQQNLQYVLNQHFEDEPYEENEQQQQQEHQQQEQQQQQNHNDVPNQNNGSAPESEDKNLLWPVLPGESGEGLPYAPIDWPEPGDFWTWRVGRRITATGYFQDRFLYVPKRLGKQYFASQPSIANYIRTNFPDADVDAFFASFAWKIPAKIQAPPKELPVPEQDQKATGQEEPKPEEYTASGRKRRSSTMQPPKQPEPPAPTPKRVKRSAAKSPPGAKQSGEKSKSTRPKRTKPTEPNEATPKSSSANRKTRQSGKKSSQPIENGAVVPVEPVIEPIPEDFDNYLNSLDDILTQPLSLNESSVDTNNDNYANRNEMTEARNRLSSLLAVDFPSLILSTNIAELAHLASKLRNDPRLNAEQLVKLKLIEEIPTFSEVFLESKELIAQVDEFFATLESKKNEAASLKKEYNELKEKTDQLQSQVDLSTNSVQEIDQEIAMLQLRRAELTNLIKGNKAAKKEILTAQTMVANSIPKVVQQIQLANAKMPELELKKTNALKREAEILQKFAPLQGFSL